MTGLDRRQTGGGEPGPEARSMPFFPGAVPQPGTPLPAPPAPGPDVQSPGANAVPMTLHGSPGDVTVVVEGRVTIEDAVIEKIAALAAQEVTGVAALAPAGARVVVGEDEVTVDVAIAVEYGSVIRDVAQVVKGNVARVAGLMLGMRVAAVNVSVEDVRMAAAPPRPRGGADQTARA
ncbi:Asp23/Gls24 family envelope stress response protein [Actinomadura formosensis]|uniref:Asp23/Gls24 family envelope stress response protein n=1 Tax=Actinomadura formosensis TaxID=60706 RepID=UPI00082B7592|nr:Asp23/Gls24 family envelope stress response protein [Actinomadura formosensis]